MLICNNDDYYCKKIIHSNKITFGFNPDSDLVIACDAGQIILSFCDEKYAIDFPFYGKHFCYDFAASFLVSILATKKIDSVLKKVQDLYLPRRRLNEYKIDDVILINDYAHHPTEIKAVYNSVKIKYPNKKYISIYQPHTFSRTNAFLENYIEALKLFDQVYIMPIFSSVREENFNEWILLEHCSSFSEYKRELKGKLLEEKDAVIVFMGAGDIDEEIHFFIQSNV